MRERRWRIGQGIGLGIGALALVGGAATMVAPDGPSKAQTSALQALVGDWNGSAHAYLAPGMPPESSGAKQQTKRIGDYWLVEHASAEVFGETLEHLYLIGFDDAGGLTGTLVTGGDRESWSLVGSYDTRTGTFEFQHQLRTAADVVVDARTTIRVDPRKGKKTTQVFQTIGEGFEALYVELTTTKRR